MDFQKEYQQKLVSADEAVKIIKSGDWVDYGWCTGTPDALDKALAKRTDELKDVKLRGGILLKPLAVFEREDAGGAARDLKTVRIGYYASRNFQDGAGNGESKGGYSYEYIQKVAAYTGWRYEYVYGTG